MNAKHTIRKSGAMAEISNIEQIQPAPFANPRQDRLTVEPAGTPRRRELPFPRERREDFGSSGLRS
jgi:hypothetical protein